MRLISKQFQQKIVVGLSSFFSIGIFSRGCLLLPTVCSGSRFHPPAFDHSYDDIQKLVGTMKRSSDVGIFVTSGQLSSIAIREARTSHKHIDLIDYARFIILWQEHYHKMNDEQRNALPLKAIHFLGE